MMLIEKQNCTPQTPLKNSLCYKTKGKSNALSQTGKNKPYCRAIYYFSLNVMLHIHLDIQNFSVQHKHSHSNSNKSTSQMDHSLVGRGRTDHDQQYCYYHVPTVNRRRLLQFISSWWWAWGCPKHVEPYLKRAINLRDWCIWLVGLFECTMMHGLPDPKFINTERVSFIVMLSCPEHRSCRGIPGGCMPSKRQCGSARRVNKRNILYISLH
jgi:hypothetical protein